MALFHSTIPALTIAMRIDGYTRYYSFTPKGRPYSYGYLYVHNPHEVSALKKHPYFGSIITIEEGDVAEDKADLVVKREYLWVTKTQDAKKVLKEEYHYDVETIRSKEQARAIADELNVSFPNL